MDRVRAGNPRASALVILRGEAGIGKTRIAEELAQSVRDDGYQVAAGSTREYANAPYAAIEEALAPLGIEAVQSSGDVHGDAKTHRFVAISDAIEAAARTSGRGLVVTLEDLHWADVGTLELLRFLAPRLAGRAVTFLATYRHDEMDAGSAHARAIAALEREADAVVTLDALPGADVERLLQSVIHSTERSVSPDVVTKIRELSDGRPLFAEELLRGVFERIDRNASAEPSVPTSIRVTVRERFASLSDSDRTILLHGAVLGRRFSARFVAAFSGFELVAVYGALRRARDLQLIVEQTDEDGDAFAFRHALTRETVYAELLRAEARMMHTKVARLLASDTVPDVTAIADHLWRAGDADAGAWNERAGDEAFAVYAYADAARAYERAHRLTENDERRAYLGERAADSWYALGDLPRSIEWFDRASASHTAAGAPGRAWRLSLRKARVLFESGRYDAGLAEADRLASTTDVDVAQRFEAEVMVAGLLTSRGRPADALARLQRIERLDVCPEPLVTARFAATYAVTLGILGDENEARSRFGTAAELARSIEDNDLLLRTYNNWGALELVYGTVERAREIYDDALRLADETKNRRIAAWIMQNAALPELLCGNFSGARALLQRGSTIAHGVHIVHRWSLGLALRVATLEGEDDRGDLDRAIAALDDAIDDADLTAVGMLAAVIAYALAAARRIAEASAVLARVVPVFEQIDAPYWLVDAASRYGDAATRDRARTLIAGVAGRDGAVPAQAVLALADAREALRRRRRDEGTALAERAVAAFREIGWTLDEAYALEMAGRVADAVAVFRRIGATAEVRRNTQTDPDAGRRRGESTLTGREREIAGLLVDGRTTRAIADTLVISERTVETHIASIYRKLGVSNRRALESLLGETAAGDIRSRPAQAPYHPG